MHQTTPAHEQVCTAQEKGSDKRDGTRMAPRLAAGVGFSLTPASAHDPVISQLVQQLDPHSGIVPEIVQAQHDCGKWIAWRRLQLAIDDPDAIARIGVDAETLRLIECGTADPSLLNNDVTIAFIKVLAGTAYKPDWVRSVVDLALGSSHTVNEGILADVWRDLCGHRCKGEDGICESNNKHR